MERHRRLHLLNYHHNEAARRKKLAAACVVLLLTVSHSSERSIWMKHWVARRKKRGCHHNLFMELQFEDPVKYRRCLRMTSEMFEYLLEKVTPVIQKKNTHLRDSIPASERLSVTLRHLATGESQESLSLAFRMGQSTISNIIRETTAAIYQVLEKDFLHFPSSFEEWKAVSHDVYERWNFPNCIGAMDGKHFVIEHPFKSGSMYHNYKETFSIVLLAVVDAQCRFIFVDAGTNGRASDRGIWNKCDFKNYLEKSNFPRAPLPNTDILFPYVVVGDEGFTLSESVMIPYPKNALLGNIQRRIFNYRLSRFRRCSENTFGILVNRFQIFRSPMRYDPEVAKLIVLAACAIHNWLRTDSVGRAMYTPPQSLDSEDICSGTVTVGDRHQGNQGTGIVRFANQGGNRHPVDALDLRNTLCSYFNGVGAVPWQYKMIGVQNH